MLFRLTGKVFKRKQFREQKPNFVVYGNECSFEPLTSSSLEA